MNRSLQYFSKDVKGNIAISGSKSESNRLLILQKIFSNIQLRNLSNSDDTKHLQEALTSNNDVIDIGHAGTAMRFLTAYFSVKNGREVVLTGSDRMKNRPVKILVEALRSIGADIQYMDKEGFPPLKIKGQKITNNKVKINGNVSSQYISALLLIAPSLENGLEIELKGKVTSVPYIKMTLALLDQLGIETQWNGNIIQIEHKSNIEDNSITVESDWSSASYFYSLVALSDNGKVTLSLPSDASFTYHIFNSMGQVCGQGSIEEAAKEHSFDLGSYKPGIYFIQLRDTRGIMYNVKVVRE